MSPLIIAFALQRWSKVLKMRGEEIHIRNESERPAGFVNHTVIAVSVSNFIETARI